MSKRFSILFSLLFAFTLLAGEKTLTIKEAILGNYQNLKVENLEQLQWIYDTENFCYVDSLNQQYGLIKVSARTQQRLMLLTLDSLNALMNRANQTPLKKFPRIAWQNAQRFRFRSGQKFFVCDLTEPAVQLINEIPEQAQNVELHPKLNYVAYTIGQNLYVSLKAGQTIQITFDTEDGILNGDSYVHRQEFGIRKGIFWSPSGKHLAFYRVDQRMVTQYPLVDIDSRPAKLRYIRYPFTGMTSEQVSVGVYHLQTGSITYLQTGEPQDHYKCSVTWSPDEQFIYVAQLNRDQNHLRLVKYDPQNGLAQQTLFEESDDQWVEPEHGLLFVNDDPNRFIWFSKRNGYNDLYLYRSDGKLLRKLTPSQWDVTRFLGFDAAGKNAFFLASANNGLDRQAFKVSLKSGRLTQLTHSSGVHVVQFQKQGKFLLDRFTNLSTPNRIALLDASGREVQVLLNAANPLQEYKIGDLKLLQLQSEAGDVLNARIIFPPDFDPAKKYPVIVYVYGGPHGQMLTNSFLRGWRWWFYYMAQKGFILFTLDNRGTNNRGLEFEQVIHRRLGTIEVQDQMVGIRYLKSQPFVDSTRIGVHGWSYGGFMTISLMTRQPGVFKVGVAGGPVIDWRYYEVMYGERYMDTPQSNPEGYETSSLLNYVQNLEGRLLIIHGTVDPVVVLQNSWLYLRKAIDLQKQVDYFVYPGDEHNMRGQDRVHLYQKISDYFLEHL
ncbi:peptidase S9B dipeptidylpeptidase IV domain protein [Caldithrix abyssi DSM 13497]|uniref:Dipeptidyl-peptidase-4 n=1 Tax=Caldithrix abyssi DSM 13497 TaxID=880073 RepID=H1XNX8_CALAY|nr:S9 family peptidase [Caldithrix abyssi]APF19819.1 dipeptidyl-peptidase-4 [Caldithrix abyssi DSM 13497]EHO39918.1 peptidase S9B dipeptidylpeptidase IV domain protein [Caldithrix abyssi DSM 13497]